MTTDFDPKAVAVALLTVALNGDGVGRDTYFDGDAWDAQVAELNWEQLDDAAVNLDVKQLNRAAHADAATAQLKVRELAEERGPDNVPPTQAAPPRDQQSEHEQWRADGRPGHPPHRVTHCYSRFSSTQTVTPALPRSRLNQTE